MNLDVNFWHVIQENFFLGEENVNNAIFKKNGDLFQNTPIHLIFYEKIPLQPEHGSFQDMPALSSISKCKVKKTNAFKADNGDDLELLLVLLGVTAC